MSSVPTGTEDRPAVRCYNPAVSTCLTAGGIGAGQAPETFRTIQPRGYEVEDWWGVFVEDFSDLRGEFSEGLSGDH
ncbi:MAG: hypothetical protein ACLFSV_03970 [Alkalispirochaeta sp.]